MTRTLVFLSALSLAAAASAAQGPARQEVQPKEPAVAPPKIEITVPGTKSEEQAKGKLRANALLTQCVIKPVMTDEEIRACVTAYRASSK